MSSAPHAGTVRLQVSDFPKVVQRELVEAGVRIKSATKKDQGWELVVVADGVGNTVGVLSEHGVAIRAIDAVEKP